MLSSIPNFALLAPLPAAATLPTANEANGAPRPASAHSFADMLRHSQSTTAPADTPAPEAADDAAPAEEATPNEPAKAPASKAKPRTTTAAGETKTAAAAQARDKPAAADAVTEKNDDSTAPAAPVDPALAQWLANLNLPPPTTPAAQASQSEEVAEAGESADVDGLGTNPTSKAGGHRGAADAALLDAAAHEEKRVQAEAQTTAAQGQRFEGIAAEAAAAHDKGEHLQVGAIEAPSRATASADISFSATPRPAAAPSTPAAVVQIATPLNAADFDKALGLNVSRLATDGVQHAELHLNPAEMGPVSVQIAIDGTQARVDFGADAAATRQALESGLPELASALREAGFTLAGGGVSQHSQSRQESSGDGSRGTSGRRGGAGEMAAPVERRSPRSFARAGGVDLYA